MQEGTGLCWSGLADHPSLMTSGARKLQATLLKVPRTCLQDYRDFEVPSSMPRVAAAKLCPRCCTSCMLAVGKAGNCTPKWHEEGKSLDRSCVLEVGSACLELLVWKIATDQATSTGIRLDWPVHGDLLTTVRPWEAAWEDQGLRARDPSLGPLQTLAREQVCSILPCACNSYQHPLGGDVLGRGYSCPFSKSSLLYFTRNFWFYERHNCNMVSKSLPGDLSCSTWGLHLCFSRAVHRCMNKVVNKADSQYGYHYSN